MRAIEKTSLWVAGMRALETERDQPLFRDPYARRLAGDQFVEELREQTRRAPMPPAIEVRTRWLDDEMAAAVDAGIRQIAVLAVGMDSRAYRLDWPAGTRFYEIDHADVMASKQERLAGARPNCERLALSVDLRANWLATLRKAGFEGAARTLWLIEGLLCYLDENAVRGLLDEVNTFSAPGSVLLMDVLGLSMLKSASAKVLHDLAQQFGTDAPEDLIQPLNWRAEVVTIAQVGERLGRWPFPVRPRGSPGVPQSYLVQATKL